MKRWIVGLAVVVLVGVGQAKAAVIIETVPVGDPGNVQDNHGDGYGAVGDNYRIGKYEVTNAQYAEFLNAVATRSDTHGLYNTNMADGWNHTGGISRTGSGTGDDPWAYSARSNRADRPVNYVSWYDTLRFANWLHNGQPTDEQGSSTTQDGAYQMSLGSGVVRKPGALFFLPSEDEWYKAAYYDPTLHNGAGGYWEYPTQSDDCPIAEAPPGTDLIKGSANWLNWYGYGYVDTTHYTTEVGAYNTTDGYGEYVSDSAYGTFDQGGNVWEWNEAQISVQTGDEILWYRGARGSAWGWHFPVHLAAQYRGTDFIAAQESSMIGFRIATIPEPGSITLLVCGLVAGLIWWRRRK